MQFNLYVFIKSIVRDQSYQANRFYNVEIKNYIQKLIDKKKYPIIIFESIFTTVYLKKLHIPKSTKTILRAHNVEHKIWEDILDAFEQHDDIDFAYPLKEGSIMQLKVKLS